MKRYLIFILFLIIIWSIQAETIKDFTLIFDESDFQIIEIVNDYSMIDIRKSEYIYKTEPGAPDLPFYMFKAVVPEGSRIEQINYTVSSEIFVQNIEIMPVQLSVPTSLRTEVPFVNPNPEFYNNNIYPQEIYSDAKIFVSRQYYILSMLISPFSYYPEEKTLILNHEIDLQITLETDDQNSAYRWDDGLFYNIWQDKIFNPEELEPYSNRSPIDPDDVKYLIITSADLMNTFQEFADWKTDCGLPAEVISLNQIYSNYSGTTEQLKIKNCIYDYYLNKGTNWVLLGGDNSVVPVQGCYAIVGNYTDTSIPADIYYACFDDQFDWNANGNSYYGETNDNIDLTPEVIISRAPVRTSTDVTTFFNKTRNYNLLHPSSNFTEKMLLMGVQIWNTWDGRSDADWRNERVWNDYVTPYWNGTHYRFYDTNTDFGGASYNVNVLNMTEQINSGYNFLFSATHGNVDKWIMETGGGFTSSDALALNNLETQGFVMTMACNTNAFDNNNDPCLSEAFLRNENGGAVAYHGSSRYAWGINYTTDYHGPSYRFSDEVYVNLFSNQTIPDLFKFGAVATQAKIHFLPYSGDYGAYRWLQFSLNSIGDPTLDIFTSNPGTITASAPESITLGNNNEITISTNLSSANICITNGDDIYIYDETDGEGDFIFTPNTIIDNPIIYTVSAHNYQTWADSIMVTPALIDPPAGDGPGNTPIVSDVEDDNGGWIELVFTLSPNDPYHSSAVTPYIDYYQVEKSDNGTEWDYLDTINLEAADEYDNRSVQLNVTASPDQIYYRMAAAIELNGSNQLSNWVDAGTASSADETPAFADFTVFLEGPYNSNNVMDHNLETNNLIPFNSPYDEMFIEELPMDNGYHIIDWVQIQLRTEPDGDDLFSTSAFLLNDGSIIDINGNRSLPYYYTSGISYYIIIRHRNHVDIMSAMPYFLSDNPEEPAQIDLSLAETIYGIGYNTLSDLNLAMVSGDGTGNNQIQNDDKNDVWKIQVNQSGYLAGDFNLNGEVQNDDKNNYWKRNVGKGSTVPLNGSREMDPIIVLDKNLASNRLTFAFENPLISHDGYYFEYDVTIQSSRENTKIGDINLYINYNDLAFGDNLCRRNGVDLILGEFFQQELIPGVSLYNTPIIADNTESRLGIQVGYNFPQQPELTDNLPRKSVLLFHVKMLINDPDHTSLLSFENSNEVPMNGQQYLSNNIDHFSVINLSNSLDILLTPHVIDREERNPELNIISNYPNPFNPSTQISFQLGYDSYCDLTIYNVKGQQVKQLFKGNVTANELKNIIWQGTDNNSKRVSSGLYFYKLQTEKESILKKMILSK